MFKTYGPDRYPQERIDLLWNEFKSVDTQVFAGIVSRLIGENSTAPMLPKFRELLSVMRESKWGHEKKKYSDEAKEHADFTNAALQTVSFQEYVCNAVKRGEKEEMYWLLKVYGFEKIQKIVEAAT